MNRRKILFIILATILLILFYILGYFLIPINTKQNLKLPSSNGNEIINYLKDKNYSVNFLDSLYLKFLTTPRKGWIYINKKTLPRYKFLNQVGGYANHYTPITIIPGETTYFVIKMLSKKLNFSIKDLIYAYKQNAIYSEGNFLANTYNIPIYFKEKDTIDFLIKNSLKEYKKLSITYLNSFDKAQWKKILIIASIIQKEAANNKEMPIIASVIYNRLKKNMKLQMDGSLNYGKYSHTKITPQRIKTDNSFYNTYKHKGLPKEPVCNVSKNAIIATLKPAKTNYLYFMRNSNGTHNFSKEYKKHIINIKKRKRYIKELKK